jgi:hydrogenase nickel incorporation protein HypA/HybF
MHELSIVQEIVHAVEDGLRDAHVTTRVRVVRLTIGKLTAVAPESVAFYFELITRDTPLHGATLDIQETPIVVACGDCEKDSALEDLDFHCPACGSENTEVVRGRELFVDSVEVDD